MLGHYLGTNLGSTVAYYPLSYNANDYSGNGYNLTTATNLSYSISKGKFGSGCSTTSSTSLYLSSTTPLIQNVGTISAWIYITAYPTSNYFALLSQSSNTNTYYLEFRFSSTGYLQLMNQSSAGDYSFTSTKAKPTLNKWTNIIITYNLVSSACSFYVNGALMDAPTGSGSYASAGVLDHSICVGCNYGYSSVQDTMVGNICEVIFEKIVWSASQIQRYYTACLGRLIL